MPYPLSNKQAIFTGVYRLTKKLFTGMLPTCCNLCHQPLPNTDLNNPLWLCEQCQPYLKTLKSDHVCQQCAIALEPPDHLNAKHSAIRSKSLHKSHSFCARCLKFSPTFDAIYCAYQYGYPLDSLINSCKEQNQPLLATYFGYELAQFIGHQPHIAIENPTIITSVPIHPNKWIARQYNPSHDMALSVIKNDSLFIKKANTDKANIEKTNFQKTALHYEPTLLIKHKDTHTQKGLSRKARLKNLEKSFSINTKHNINHKNIIVIDDVVTTTATAHIISHLLKKSGAKTVTFWALARTPNR